MTRSNTRPVRIALALAAASAVVALAGCSSMQGADQVTFGFDPSSTGGIVAADAVGYGMASNSTPARAALVRAANAQSAE
jgi:hypothetical protein